MKGIVLAAGKGSRLAPYTGSYPKPLLPVCGKPLIEYTLDSLAQAGITELVVVVGFGAEQVGDWLTANNGTYGIPVHRVYNPNFELGNGYSLYQARSLAGSTDFVVTMADHLLSVEAILPVLHRFNGEEMSVGIDYGAQDLAEEATRVWVGVDGYVRQIGKGLGRYNGIDAGVFRLSPAIFSALEDVMAGGGDSLSAALTRFIQKGGNLHACDISGAFWLDVDTYDDWRRAEVVLGEW